MFLIELTNPGTYEKFSTRGDLIEVIEPRHFRGGCSIRLTTGAFVECTEDRQAVIDLWHEGLDKWMPRLEGSLLEVTDDNHQPG